MPEDLVGDRRCFPGLALIDSLRPTGHGQPLILVDFGLPADMGAGREARPGQPFEHRAGRELGLCA